MDNQQLPPPNPIISPPPLPTVPQDPVVGYPAAPEPHTKNRKVRWVIIIVVIALMAASVFAAYTLTHRKHLPVKPNNSASLTKPPATAASAVTPLGRAASGSSDTADIAISVTQVVTNPQTTGDAPDAGMKYVEIDLSVTNSGKSTVTLPGTFAYQTAAGNYIFPASTVGKPGDPNKNVQIAGKASVNDLSLGPEQTDSSHYVLYQVPAADSGGKLVWFDGYYDTKSTKLAIFSLT